MKKRFSYILLVFFAFITLLFFVFVLISSKKPNGLILNIQNQSTELIQDIEIYLYGSQNKIMLIEITDLKSSDRIDKIIEIENHPKNQDYVLVIDFITNDKEVASFASYLPSITGRIEVNINMHNIDSNIIAEIEYKDFLVERIENLKIN